MPTASLRDLEAGDKSRLLQWRNAPEVARYMYTDHPISEAEHERWWTGIPGDRRRRYWIIEIDGAPAGLANLYDIDLDHRRCGWAFYLAEVAARGRGVGAYVEYAVIEHVFGALGLHKLNCEVFASNEPVWKLHQSFGFQLESHLRDHIWKDGRFHDVLGLGLLKTDWDASRDRCRSRLQRAKLLP